MNAQRLLPIGLVACVVVGAGLYFYSSQPTRSPDAVHLAPQSAQQDAVPTPGLPSLELNEAPTAKADLAPVPTPAVEPEVRPTKSRAELETEAWLEKWGTASIERLESEYQRHSLALAERANPLFEAAFVQGDREVVGTGQSYAIPADWDPTLMTQIRSSGKDAPDQNIYKIQLRETEYPELYALHREGLWMMNRIQELQRLARAK